MTHSSAQLTDVYTYLMDIGCMTMSTKQRGEFRKLAEAAHSSLTEKGRGGDGKTLLHSEENLDLGPDARYELAFSVLQSLTGEDLTSTLCQADRQCLAEALIGASLYLSDDTSNFMNVMGIGDFDF